VAVDPLSALIMLSAEVCKLDLPAVSTTPYPATPPSL